MKTTKMIIAALAAILVSLSLALTGCSDSDEGTAAVGISSARINESGELVLSYTDGTEQNIGVVVGQDGLNGADGVNGQDGKDGIDGRDGKDGVDGVDGIDGKDGVLLDGSAVSPEPDIPKVTSNALRSTVRIVSNFTKTVQGSGWRPSTTTSEYYSEGSGVIYKIGLTEGDAFIITNYHVVYDSSSNTENGISDDISVYLYGSEYADMAIPAEYVGGSLYYDIAVLRVEDSERLRDSYAKAITVADSDKIAVGDTAIAVGNAAGYGISASFGAVSVGSEYITMTAADNSTTISFRVIRVDSAVNSGNSGGGLFDENGELIGIVNAKIIDDGVESIGYAIPSNVAISVADNIIEHCFGTDKECVMRAVLGITVSISDSEMLYDEETGLVSIKETVSVLEVSEGAIAEGLLLPDDVLVSITVGEKSVTVTKQYHVVDAMLDARVGDTVMLTVLRGGEETAVSVTVTEECITEY